MGNMSKPLSVALDHNMRAVARLEATLAEACEVIRTLLNYCLRGSETIAAEKFLERVKARRG